MSHARIPLRFVVIMTMLMLSISVASASWQASVSPDINAPTATNASVLNENFDSGALPTGWVASGTPTWRFDNPGGRPNESGGTGNFAIVDSDNAGEVPMDASLTTPSLNLTGHATVKLTFKSSFKAYNISKADVSVSTDGGNTWTSIWSKTGADYKGTTTLTVAQAANQANVRFRFRYYDANWDWYWQLDDVLVEGVAAPSAPSTLSAQIAGNNVNLAWTDNSSNETNFIVERSPDGTTGWVEARRVAANATAFTHNNVTCGTTIHYRVKAVSGALASGYSNTANVSMPACPPATNTFSENFDAAQSLPAGWTLVNQFSNSFWQFDQPNQLGTTGNAPIAANGNGSQLRTPVMSFHNANAVLLKFNSRIFNWADQTPPQSVAVDISKDGGETWTNVWRKNSEYNGQELVIIDVSAVAANQSRVMVRFHSHLYYSNEYWQIDNVEIGPLPAPSTPTNLSATLSGTSDVLLAWNGSLGAKYKVERSADSGTTWTQIADLTNGATTYKDGSVANLTAYQYRIRAYNTAGESSNSTVASITTADKSIRYIDVTISLHSAAQISTAADRAKFEANIHYFADAIYEASNGANRLRKVTFYRDGKNFNTSHIQWIASCHPNAHVGGYWNPGQGERVEHCDDFDGTTFLNTVQGQQGGGSTLAHEFGHFFYGLYDEYKGNQANNNAGSPQPSDPGTSIAIMNSQWEGFNDYRYLNFSSPVGTNFSLQSAQGRVFGADAWTVLARPKNKDPQNSSASYRPYLPELAAVAPSGTAPAINLPSAAARANLQIVWVPGFTARPANIDGTNAVLSAPNSHIREIVIDRSALMADNGYLDDVKTAVATLVNQIPTGDTVGIITFDGTATVVHPLTDIVDQTTKDALISALNDIVAGDTDTAGGDALQAAHTALTADGVPADVNRSVYFITTGSNSMGVAPITVMPAYEDDGIPLHVFGFDPLDSDEANLRLLAELTGGDYTTVQNAGDLTKALNMASSDTSPIKDVTLAFDDTYVEGGVPFTYTVAVDETLDEVDFEFTYYGEVVSATVTLTDPDNDTYSIVPADDCDTYGTGFDAETICYIGYFDPPAGDWTITVNAPDDIFFIYYVAGVAPEGQTTYDAVAYTVDGDLVTYPEPIVVEAVVSRGYSIGGLVATGWLYEPNGNKLSVDFKDDGVAPDAVADDGIYSAYVDYTEDGESWVTVHFDNSNGTGFYTDQGVVYQLSPPEEPLPAVTENFERYAEVQISVKGWQEDDHADWPDDPDWPATVLTLDNIPVHGRIDVANDVDTFQIVVPADYAETTLGVRINQLGLGMDPYVLVYAEDYSWVYEHYLEEVATNDDALFFSVDVTPGETFYVEVWHYEDTETGTYRISAGPELWSDPIATRSVKPTTTYKIMLPIIRR